MQHNRGGPANGDLTPCLSHEAVCPEEEMGVTGSGGPREKGMYMCVAMGRDRVRILGQ